MAREFLDPATTRGQVLRFLVVGGTNTAATTIVFYVLTTVVSLRVAFTAAYAAGLAFTVLATPRLVFGSVTSRLRRAALALWYLGTYGVGVAIITALRATGAPRLVVVLLAVMVTAPLGFTGARLLVGRQRGYVPGAGSSPAESGSTPSG